jgi:ComF family protein
MALIWGGRGEYIGQMLRHLIQRIFRHIPSQCAVCHAWPSQPVCENCIEQFAQPVARCSSCALALASAMRQCGACITNPPPLDLALAAVPYAYPWSRLLVDFKFHQQPGWASSFATLMRSAPWVEPALDAADLVIPMPLSRQRLQERGFNQAQLLANALESTKVAGQLLLRVVDTPSQRTLSKKNRLDNVRDAFAVDPLQLEKLKDKRVVIVDDVMTSGASLHAAAHTLRRAGAVHISGLVFARTE